MLLIVVFLVYDERQNLWLDFVDFFEYFLLPV